MIVILTLVFIGVLLQPVLLVIAIAAGGLSKKWLPAMLGGVGAGVIAFVASDPPSDHSLVFTFSIAAGVTAAALAFGLKRQLTAGR